MTEDTNWLKKNPMMNLWRSSRFFGPDMDASVMANDQKSGSDILAVSHMPRRSNIPIEKIKQMDFKFPAPISKKAGVTKPVSRISKFVVPQVSVSRTSINPKSGENKTGIQKQNFKSIGRPSIVSKPTRATMSSSTAPGAKSKIVQRTPKIVEKFDQHSVKTPADLSLLSQSKVVNQSTPNETSVLRSILKQNKKSCARNLLDNKKSTAAKRVNFNGSLLRKSKEKENENIVEGILHRSSQQKEKKSEITECDEEESTVAFSKSFKPIPVEEDYVNGKEEIETEKNIIEDVKECEGGDLMLKTIDKIKTENSISDSSEKSINSLMDVWKVYRNRFSDIRNELHLIDETFQSNLKLLINNDFEDKMSLYEEEKHKLYKQLRDLEIEFREKVKESTEVRPLFLNYVERKKNIFKIQSEIEEKFEKALYMILEKSGFEIGKNDRNNDSPMELASDAVEKVKKISGTKRKSGCCTGVKTRGTPRKRRSGDIKSSGGSTPDNTPARRKKLSRKIEKQIRNLFEE